MSIVIRKAERKKAKLRLAIIGPSGSGKTYSSLKLAFGIGGKVGLIDTENGSGDLYAHLGDYDVVSLTPPYTVKKYLEAITAFEEAGYTTIIIDSLSHAWAGEGGLLDKQGKAAAQGGNSYTAWRQITPEHNSLIERILRSPCHVIATMRAKQEYVQEKDERTGKTVVRKVGLAPVMRDGVEYEFTVVLDVTAEHVANASKDRTGIFAGDYFKVDEGTGKTLLAWLESGKEPEPAYTHSRDYLAEINSAPDSAALKSILDDVSKEANSLPEQYKAVLRTAYERKKQLIITENSVEV